MAESSLSDWIMVIITGIYMIATIAIFVANLITANSSKRQLKESQEQFEESSRLACIPYLQVETARSETADFILVLPPSIDGDRETARLPIESPKIIIKNVGSGSATNMYYGFSHDDSKEETGTFPINAIMKGDQYSFLCVIPKEISKATLKLFYTDFIGNEYNQRINLEFTNNDLSLCDNDKPRLVGE